MKKPKKIKKVESVYAHCLSLADEDGFFSATPVELAAGIRLSTSTMWKYMLNLEQVCKVFRLEPERYVVVAIADLENEYQLKNSLAVISSSGG